MRGLNTGKEQNPEEHRIMQELDDDVNICIINPQEAQWALRVSANQTQQTKINMFLVYQGNSNKIRNNQRPNQNF